MSDLKTTIMQRDGLTSQQADDLINEAKWRVHSNGESPEDVLQELGLEPDYFLDLM